MVFGSRDLERWVGHKGKTLTKAIDAYVNQTFSHRDKWLRKSITSIGELFIFNFWAQGS